MIYEVHDSGFEGLTTMWQRAAEPCSTRGSESDEIFFFNLHEPSKQQKSCVWHK